MQLPIWMPGLGSREHVRPARRPRPRGRRPRPARAVVVEGVEAAAQDRRASAQGRPHGGRHALASRSFRRARVVSARRAAPSSIAHRAFTTWSLEGVEPAESSPERGGATRGRANRGRGRAGPRRLATRRSPRSTITKTTTKTTRCATTRRPSSTRVRCRGVARRRGADPSTRCRSCRAAWRSRRCACCSCRRTRVGASATRSACSSRVASGSAIHTPGHTIDHLCLYDPEYGLLLSGDHVLPSITPHISGVGNGADALQSVHPDARSRRRARRRGARACRRTATRSTDVPGRVEAIKEHHEERMMLIEEGVDRDRAGHGAAALARDLPAQALGRDGRERDVRPPRAHGDRRGGRALERGRRRRSIGFLRDRACRRPGSDRPPPTADPQRVRQRRHGGVGQRAAQRRPAPAVPRHHGPRRRTVRASARARQPRRQDRRLATRRRRL